MWSSDHWEISPYEVSLDQLDVGPLTYLDATIISDTHNLGTSGDTPLLCATRREIVIDEGEKL